jgi:hypothetical protein
MLLRTGRLVALLSLRAWGIYSILRKGIVPGEANATF